LDGAWRGIVFDLFGTIIPRPERMVHAKMMNDIGALLGIDEEIFRKIWLSMTYEKSTWNSGDTVDLMELVQERLDILPERTVSQEMTNIWDRMTLSHFQYFDDVVPSFRSLKEQGYRIGLLTNCGPNVPTIVRASEIGPLLDGAAYSSEIGRMKPDPMSYDIACKEIGVPNKDVFFIGDGDSNELAGAVDAGLKAIKIERGKIAGDYRLTEEVEWEPCVSDLWNILDVVQSL